MSEAFYDEGYYGEFVNYYLNEVNGDPVVHAQDASDVTSAIYDEDGHIQLVDWTSSYPQPNRSTLIGYDLATVQTFFQDFYLAPMEIAADQHFAITTSDLLATRADSSMIGDEVLDTTARAVKSWNGSVWLAAAQLFLLLSGGNMTGSINMGSHSITNAGYASVTSLSATTATLGYAGSNFNMAGYAISNSSALTTSNLIVTTPHSLSATTTSSAANSFTANTARMINVGNFTVNSNPSNEFSINAATGQITYSGVASRYVRIAADWSFDTVSPVVTTTLTMYLAKNGGSVISGKTKQWTFTLSLVASRIGASISDTILMATNDTVQLGGSYTATASLTFYSLGYDIVQAS